MFEGSKLLGCTKLKEYESSEKLASRSVTSDLTPAGVGTFGPRMSATVMSQLFRGFSFAAPKLATGSMRSAVNTSCASTEANWTASLPEG